MSAVHVQLFFKFLFYISLQSLTYNNIFIFDLRIIAEFDLMQSFQVLREYLFQSF